MVADRQILRARWLAGPLTQSCIVDRRNIVLFVFAVVKSYRIGCCIVGHAKRRTSCDALQMHFSSNMALQKCKVKRHVKGHACAACRQHHFIVAVCCSRLRLAASL